MIVGGYTLDLYCDTRHAGLRERQRALDERRPRPGAVVGRRRDRLRVPPSRAPGAGWILDLVAGTARCPPCAGRRPVHIHENTRAKRVLCGRNYGRVTRTGFSENATCRACRKIAGESPKPEKTT